LHINSSKKPNTLDVFKSVAASVFGVQSAKNRERDFQQQSIVPYIVVGVIFVMLLIFSLVGLVSIIV
jgi:diacylglycerol kinase